MHAISGQFTGRDVGAPALAGSSTRVGSGFDVTAGGVDIWDQSDQFHFVCRPVTGDFELQVRVESAELTHPYTKIGLMARADAQADAPHFLQWVFADNRARNSNSGGYEAQFRRVQGGACAAIYPANKDALPPLFPVHFPNAWMRLSRKNNAFKAEASSDGESWHTYTEMELPLPQCSLVGLAVTSHDANASTHASFRDFSFTSSNPD